MTKRKLTKHEDDIRRGLRTAPYDGIHTCSKGCKKPGCGRGLKETIEEQDQENARLKAEVERLTFDPLTYLDDQGEWMPRHTHLDAVERLKAEVERLINAGDAMADRLMYQGYPATVQEWNAAKEGKQS